MYEVLACPSCHEALDISGTSAICSACQRDYVRDNHGFLSFITNERDDPGHIQEEWYVDLQETYPIRVYREFLKRLISVELTNLVLDVGCGLGTEVEEARKDGYDSYGVDLPNMGPYWRRAGRDPSRFFECNAVRLPFRSDMFDFVWSLGVIEHIGTNNDTATLTEHYDQARCQYASELIRVTKPGGRIIVSCPNKSFPIDIHHGPTCGDHFKRLRWHIYNKTKLNIHKTWGKYHLLSYSETRRLFVRNSLVENVRALPLKDYFAFNSFQSGYLAAAGAFVRFYVEHLPSFLLPTFLNPYMLVMIRKKAEQGDDGNK